MTRAPIAVLLLVAMLPGRTSTPSPKPGPISCQPFGDTPAPIAFSFPAGRSRHPRPSRPPLRSSEPAYSRARSPGSRQAASQRLRRRTVPMPGRRCGACRWTRRSPSHLRARAQASCRESWGSAPSVRRPRRPATPSSSTRRWPGAAQGELTNEGRGRRPVTPCVVGLDLTARTFKLETLRSRRAPAIRSAHSQFPGG